MILNVTYRYKAMVRAPRQRTAREAYFIDTMPVEVRELSAREAPVAMRFTEDLIGRAVRKVEREMRWDGETLYRLRVGQNSAAVGRDAAWLRGMAEGGYLQPYDGENPFGTYTDYQDRNRNVRMEDDADVAHVDGSEREAAQDKIRALAAGIVLIDGMLHIPSLEPVYLVVDPPMFHNRDYPRYVSPKIYDPKEMHALGNVYRADEREYMLAHMRIAPEGFGPEAEIEVVIPEALRADIAEREMLREAEKLENWYAERIAQRDVRFFENFAALRDGVADFKRARRQAGAGPEGILPVQVDVMPLADVLRRVVDRTEGLQAYQLHNIQAAFERLDTRALAHELGGPGL